MLRSIRTWLGGAIMPPDESTPKPGNEKTGPQTAPKPSGVVVGNDKHQLIAPKAATIATWREMRTQPTIALARSMFSAPLRQLNFVVEAEDGTPPAWIDAIQRQYDVIWKQFMHDIVYAFDYGWQAFEEVYALDPQTNLIMIDKLKLLIADTTQVVLDEKTGAYKGLTNGGKRQPFGLGMTGGKYLAPEYTFWYANDREGSNWYGESVMERARLAYNRWNEADSRSDRYLTSVAGPVPLVQYPMGEAQTQGGQSVSNLLTAQSIIEGLSRCRGVAMPNVITAWADQLLNAGADPSKLEAWKISFLETTAMHGKEFLDQQHAKEVDFLRAWLVPERAAIEGIHGTKAEADSHGMHIDEVVSIASGDIMDAANRYITDRVLIANFGPAAPGKVWGAIEEIDEDKRTLLRELVKGVLGAPVNSDLLMELLDMENAFEVLGLPPAKDMADAINEMNEPKPEPPVMIPAQFQPNQPPPAPDTEDDEADAESQRMARQDARQVVLDVAHGSISREAGRVMLSSMCGVDAETAAELIAGIAEPEPKALPPPPVVETPTDPDPVRGDLSYTGAGDSRRWFRYDGSNWLETKVIVENGQ